MANLSVERPNTPVKHSNKSKYPINTPTNRRDTLLARAREEEEEEALSIDKFKELL